MVLSSSSEQNTWTARLGQDLALIFHLGDGCRW